MWASAFTPDDEALAVIDDVAPGVTRTLLTNNDALLHDALSLMLPAVHARIAVPLFSATTPGHRAVPSRLRCRAGGAGCGPGRRVVRDDSQSNIDGALRMGIATVHFTSAERLRSELVRAGLLV